MNAVLTGQGWEGVPEATRKQADTAWFRSVLQWDPEPVVKKVDQPLLIMHGALDKQVPVASAELLNGLAAKRKKGPALWSSCRVSTTCWCLRRLVSLPNTAAWLARRSAPLVATQIADWLKQLPR